MKKLYISPKAVAFNVEAEAQLMVDSGLGINNSTGEIDGGMTREQNIESPWDNWNE